MAIWVIRYKDRFGARRSIYHEQAWKPSADEAFEALQKNSNPPEGSLQNSRSNIPTMFGVEILGIDEIPPEPIM